MGTLIDQALIAPLWDSGPTKPKSSPPKVIEPVITSNPVEYEQRRHSSEGPVYYSGSDEDAEGRSILLGVGDGTVLADPGQEDGNKGSSGKPSLSAHKKALEAVHKELGGSLPKGKQGKFGSPQRGTPKKGYRLDPPHPGKVDPDPEAKTHINWWDYTKGKKGKGGRHGAIPIED